MAEDELPGAFRVTIAVIIGNVAVRIGFCAVIIFFVS
jgi:hypothetical protein